MAPDDVLAQAVDGLADGAVLNWSVLQGLARSDDDRDALEWLQVLGRIADVHRSNHDQAEVEESLSTRTLLQVPDTSHRLPTWGRYRLLRKIGSGSFGSVHCAWDPELERHVAIKILHDEVADDSVRQRLLREGRALARVQHANVVQVFGVETHGDRVALCMQFIEGETLAGVLRAHGRFSDREATVVGQDVCRALAAVHEAGYVHRDVKAQNVMRDKAGKIVLMDFGTGHQSSGGRRPRDLVGTPAYMAPEALDGQPATVQTDVYAVGVLLYHLVTGRYPVEGGTLLDLIDAHKAGRRHALLDRRPDLPLPFVQVVSRALAVQPAERWPSASAMLEALAALHHDASVDSHTTWTQTVVRALAGAATAVAALVVFGMITSRYFNVVLGREAFAGEGLRDWFYWGAVSMLAPLILALLVLVGLSLLRAAARLLWRMSATMRRLADWLSALQGRLGLNDVEGASTAALVASVFFAGSALVYVWPQFLLLFDLIEPSIESRSSDDLRYLSRSFEGDHENYRLAFEWAAILTAAVWWSVWRMARAARQALNPILAFSGGAVFLLTLLLLQFPYRLLYQAEFAVVEWRQQRCYVLGDRGGESLLYCPDLDLPRTRVVRTDEESVRQIGARLNPFDHATPLQEQP